MTPPGQQKEGEASPGTNNKGPPLFSTYSDTSSRDGEQKRYEDRTGEGKEPETELRISG